MNFNDLINKYKGLLSGAGKTLSNLIPPVAGYNAIKTMQTPQFKQSVQTVSPKIQGLGQKIMTATTPDYSKPSFKNIVKAPFQMAGTLIGGTLSDIGTVGKAIGDPAAFKKLPNISLESFMDVNKPSKASVGLAGLGLIPFGMASKSASVTAKALKPLLPEIRIIRSMLGKLDDLPNLTPSQFQAMEQLVVKLQGTNSLNKLRKLNPLTKDYFNSMRVLFDTVEDQILNPGVSVGMGTKAIKRDAQAGLYDAKFKTANDVAKYFEKQTGTPIQRAEVELGGWEMRRGMGNTEPIPYNPAQLKLIEKYNALKNPSSQYLFHTTPTSNLESIAKEGLVTGKPARFEGVSSPNQISLSANEASANYYGGNNDTMIRISRKYAKTIDDLKGDYLAGGEGIYTTGKNIPPEALEVKVNGKWQPLKNVAKQPVGDARTLYRGVGESTGRAVSGNGLYLTKTVEDAKAYGKPTSYQVPKNLNLYDGDMLTVRQDIAKGNKEHFENIKPQEITDYLKKKGFDGVERPDEIVIFDPKKSNVSQPLSVQPKGGVYDTAKFDTPEILKAREISNNIAKTIDINTPERIVLRDKITNDLYGNGATVKARRVDIVLGSPASGKSSRLVEPLAKQNGSLIIDSDQVKKLLPEYQNGLGANAVHKESALIADDKILEKAILNGDNIVLPRLGKNPDTMKTLVDTLKEAGYDVHLHFVDLPAEQAAQRVVTRFNETGRFVDPAYIFNEVDGKPKLTYNNLKNYDKITSYEAYDNNVPFGQQPILIEKGTNERAVSNGGKQLFGSNGNRGNQASNLQTSRINLTQPKGVEVTKPVSVVSQKPPISIKPQEGQIIKSTTQTGGITKPTQIVETSKLQGNQLGQKQLGVGGTKQLAGAETSDTIISRLKSKTNRIYTDVIDRFHPLSATAKMAGKDQEMRNALTGHYGAGSTAQYHVDFELSPILKEQNIDELRKAAVAMRDVELATRGIKGSNIGAEVSALGPVGKAPKGTQQYAEALARLNKLKEELGPEKMQSLGETLKKLYSYQDEIVKKYLVNTGIISKDAYSTMRANNQFYVPFKRVMDTVDDFLGFTPQTRGAGSVGSQNVIFKIKGSDKQIIDPIESILESTYKSVGLGKRQQVAQTIVSLKDKLPKGMIRELKGPVGNTPNISLFVDGKVKHYSVPMEVAEAAKGLKEESLNTIVKILSVPTQVFRTTATGINPEFMAPNIARDVQSAFVNVGLNPFKWTRGVAHMMKKDELYKDFLKYGGKTSRISIDRPMLTKTVRDITKGFTIKKPSDLLKGLQVMGEYSEQPTRIAVFEQELVKGLKKGLSKDQAAIRAANWAQDATVNFARRGAKTQSVNAIYAFLNARAQGIDRLLRTFKNDPIGGAFRIGFVTQVPALAGYAWNRQFDSYYDDRVVSPTDRRTNFIIMLSDTPIQALGGAQFIKIPKGDIGRLANPTEEFLRFAENKGGDVKKALFDVVRGFSPWDNIGDLIPTALRPPIEATVNKSFFTGYPIVPEYKTSLPPKYQDSSYTSPLYRMLGQKMGVSPAKLQAVVEGYGTGISKIVEMSTRGLVPDKYKTAKNEQGADINKTPIVRRFLGGEKRTQEEQLKTDASKVSSINFQINDVKSAIKRGDIPQDEGIKEIQKLQQEQSKIATKVSGSTTTDNKTWVLTATGGLKEIDLSFPMPTLKTSTSTLVNKEYLTDYRGQLTTLKNEVMIALDAGKITEADAEKAIAKINSARVSTTTKKVPKPSLKIKALKIPKIKTTKVKKITVKRKKLKKYKLKVPKLKKSKIKLSANLT